MSLFVIAGATGHIGNVAAHALLAAGHQVRAIVRSEDKGAALRTAGAELAIGELEDAAFLTRALTGADGAMLLIPPNMGAPDVRAAQRTVLDAEVASVGASRIPHVVFISSWGAEQPAGTGPIVGLHHAEKELPATGARFTFIRAAMFAENMLGSLPAAQHQGILPSFTLEHLGAPFIATRDIADLVVQSLLHPPTENEVVYLLGPIEYKPADQALVLGKLLGKAVNLITIPVAGAAAALQQAGLPPSISALYQEMYEAVNSGLLKLEEGYRIERGKLNLEEALRPYLKQG